MILLFVAFDIIELFLKSSWSIRIAPNPLALSSKLALELVLAT